ncbi:tRNA (uridine(54)-C5)-methyltransferase TrmA [Sulfurimonas sp. HSL3-7]|uniref:tRNA (uridine(54)-C5)-methyltransferase TrmA n=1 Tax=Sulfonitrofixus jiaomeiensis TaxID=3131938 RepID=UPI0031F7D28A
MPSSKTGEEDMDCKHFGECGSCRLYDGGYAAQHKLKSDGIHDLFKELYSGEITPFFSPDSHYRARAEFKVWHVGDDIRYAMNPLERGAKMVLIDECPMVIEPIEKLMWPLLESIKELEMGFKLFGLDFLSSSEGEIAVSMLYHRKLDEAWQEQANVLADRHNIKVIGRSRKQKVVIGEDFVTETLTINGKPFKFRHIENSFTQPNPRVNEKMIGWSLKQFEGISGDLLELYCGAGNFTIPFASQFEKVLATEISKSSINAAKTNMALNGEEKIEFVRMSAEEFVQALDGVREFRRMKEIDLSSYELRTIFVDPPRAGMDEASCDFASRFEHILYISCNPESLKRDLEYLTKTHTIDAMAMFDQFPYTGHMEMGVKLTRR